MLRKNVIRQGGRKSEGGGYLKQHINLSGLSKCITARRGRGSLLTKTNVRYSRAHGHAEAQIDDARSKFLVRD